MTDQQPVYRNYGDLGVNGIGILPDDAVDRVLATPHLDLAPERRDLARVLIKDAVLDLVRHSMTRRLTSDEIRRIEKHHHALLDYLRMGQDLNRVAYSPPPLPDPNFLRQLENWLDDVKKAHEKFGKGGRPPQFWNEFYMPAALGLFEAIFEHEPRATAHRRTNDEGISGHAARFVEQLRVEVRDMIVTQGIVSADPEQNLGASRWPDREPESLAKAIADCLREDDPSFQDAPLVSADGRPIFLRKTYHCYRDYFRHLLEGGGPFPLTEKLTGTQTRASTEEMPSESAG